MSFFGEDFCVILKGKFEPGPGVSEWCFTVTCDTFRIFTFLWRHLSLKMSTNG
jgi:hypothetical protein